MVAWTREVDGVSQLAAARCAREDCCALPLHDLLEGEPGLEAVARWGAAIAAPEGVEPSVLFAATLPGGATHGVYGVKLQFLTLPSGAAAAGR